MENWNLLKNKTIIAILDGDTFSESFEIEGRTITNSLPYLSGTTIVSISNTFGLPQVYSSSSRWEYFSSLIEYCIDNNKMSDLLKYLFAKDKFSEKLRGLSPEAINETYEKIYTSILNKINSELYFGGHQLSVIGNNYMISKINEKVELELPSIKVIDRTYIKDMSKRALEEVEISNYDSAITKSRTLLEEVFIYAIEKQNETPTAKGDINKLYKQVKDLYSMHASHDIDVRINKLLSGLEKILTGIGEMRNINSDAHGVGSSRVNIDKHHAMLFVNSANTMAEFILSVVENKK